MKGVVPHPFDALPVELLDVGKPASQQHRIRIQDGNDPAQAASELVQKGIEGGPAARLPCPGPGDDPVHAEALAVAAFEGRLDPGAADPGLHAAAIAAVT